MYLLNRGIDRGGLPYNSQEKETTRLGTLERCDADDEESIAGSDRRREPELGLLLSRWAGRVVIMPDLNFLYCNVHP
jgi:hypothetical protein